MPNAILCRIFAFNQFLECYNAVSVSILHISNLKSRRSEFDDLIFGFNGRRKTSKTQIDFLWPISFFSIVWKKKLGHRILYGLFNLLCVSSIWVHNFVMETIRSIDLMCYICTFSDIQWTNTAEWKMNNLQNCNQLFSLSLLLEKTGCATSNEDAIKKICVSIGMPFIGFKS